MESDVDAAGLMAAVVLCYAHAFEANPAIAHQHRQRKRQQSQNRFAGACANPAFVQLPVARFDSKSLAVRFKHPTRLIDVHTIVSKRERLATMFAENHYRHHANAECKEQSSEWLFPLSTLNSAL